MPALLPLQQIAYNLDLTFKVISFTMSTVFYLLDFLLPGLVTVLKTLPWLFHFFAASVHSTLKGLHICADVIGMISKPVVYVLDLVLWIFLSESMYNSVTAYTHTVFSYATIWVVSLFLIVVGSLIAATEERTVVPEQGHRRSMLSCLRPKTTVPLSCLALGCLLHYDTVRSSEWIPSAVLFTGALWYCISLAVAAGEKRTDARRRALRGLASNLNEDNNGNRNGVDANVASAFRLMREQNQRATRRRDAAAERDKITPSKLTKVKLRNKGTKAGNGDVDEDGDSEDIALTLVDGGPGGCGDVIRVIQEPACPICLVDFVNDEVLRVLPCCRHTFHEDCVGEWLEKKDICPLCRAEIDSTARGRWGFLVHALFE